MTSENIGQKVTVEAQLLLETTLANDKNHYLRITGSNGKSAIVHVYYSELNRVKRALGQPDTE